jgi:hypothetical protein
MTFSFLAGLSIGLFVLPLAAALLLWVASRAPHRPDVLGFAAGLGGVLVLVGFLNRAGTGGDSVPWLLIGLSIDGCALLAYGLLRRPIRASP